MWILNASEDGHPGRLVLLTGCDGVWIESFFWPMGGVTRLVVEVFGCGVILLPVLLIRLT